MLPDQSLGLTVKQTLLWPIHIPLHSVDYVLGLLLVRHILIDLIVEPLHNPFMTFLGHNLLLIRVNLRGDLYLLVVAILRILTNITVLLSEIGEVASRFLFLFDLLLGLRQGALILLLRYLGFLFGLDLFNDLSEGTIAEFRIVGAFLLRPFFL